MTWLIDFFKSLGEFIITLVDLVLTLIGSLFDFLANIPTFINFITGSFGALPSFLLPFATISLTISVIFIIIGRGKSN